MHIDFATLTENAAQLSAPDFDRFLDSVFSKRAKSRAPSASLEEQMLLEKIYQKWPAALAERLAELRQKSENETLAAAELAEYRSLGEAAENRAADRLEQIAVLARLRGVSPKKLIEQLGVLPFYAQ